MIIIRHDAAAIVMDLGGMIDQPNSHPQKEEYFLLLLVLLFLDLLR